MCNDETVLYFGVYYPVFNEFVKHTARIWNINLFIRALHPASSSKVSNYSNFRGVTMVNLILNLILYWNN